MKPLPAIPEDVAGKRVFVRVDFNVPTDGKTILDDFRIARTLPVIMDLAHRGARVIVASHWERENEHPSLRPVAEFLRARIPDIQFVEDIAGDAAGRAVSALASGGVLMLENLRQDPGEVKNDDEFARRLAALADMYVNEAFSVSHRAHASIIGVPKLLPSYAGPLFREEVEHLEKAFAPVHPFLFIVGGKKMSTKAPLLDAYASKADVIALGSALAEFCWKEHGHAWPPSILPPRDFVIARGGERLTIEPEKLEAGDAVYDLGPRTTAEIAGQIRKSRLIVWNGPVGFFEGGYTEGTRAIVDALVASDAEIIAGGGETVQFLKEFGYLERFPFVSTGGGAMLDFLANGTLPGIEALFVRS